MSNILFVVSSMQGGGAERVAALLCNRWVGQGHHVILLATFSGRGDCFYELDDRVKLTFLADRASVTGKGVGKMMHRFISLRRTIKKARPDTVVSFLSNVNVATLLATMGLSVPVVVSERNYPPAKRLAWHWEWLRRITYPMASTVVMQTRQGLDWLSTDCPSAVGCAIPNPVVYPLPVIEPRVSPAISVKPHRFLLLAVGRLEPQKQFDDLIRSFSFLTVTFPDWDLAIIGEGSERTHLERLASEAGIANRVLLPGRVGNISDWYDHADVFVMSSGFEGFPNALLEAMAYGLPVVSFDCDTGPRDIIRDGVDGFLVPLIAGREGLASAMKTLMRDEALRKNIGENATSVRQRFSISYIGKLWDEVLGIEARYNQFT